MKIIYVLNHFLPDQVAGTEIYTLALAKEMIDVGFEVVIVIPNFGKCIKETYYMDGIRVIKFAEPTIVNKAIILGNLMPKGVVAFKKIIENEKPSIVHFQNVGGSNGISLHHLQAIKQLDIKIVSTFHIAGYTCKTGNLLYKNNAPCDGRIETKKCTLCVYESKGFGSVRGELLFLGASLLNKFGYDARKWNNTIGTALSFPFIISEHKENLFKLESQVDKLVVLTKWYKKVLEFNGIGSNKLVFISQGLPSKQLPNEHGSSFETLRFVFVGRIHESKGLHLILKALQEIGNNKICLDIYGGINDQGYANQLKNISHGMDNIKWMGIIEPQLIVETLQKYDCLCVPSVICEMSPLVIQEAFAAGIPVLASNVYGNAEQIIDGKDGWLFKFNDIIDLRNKLKTLIENPNLIDKAKQNIRPVKPFKKVGMEHLAMYTEILESL
jgi:glycosyltransferase involved in cell wall biosynthesis